MGSIWYIQKESNQNKIIQSRNGYSSRCHMIKLHLLRWQKKKKNFLFCIKRHCEFKSSGQSHTKPSTQILTFYKATWRIQQLHTWIWEWQAIRPMEKQGNERLIYCVKNKPPRKIQIYARKTWNCHMTRGCTGKRTIFIKASKSGNHSIQAHNSQKFFTHKESFVISNNPIVSRQHNKTCYFLSKSLFSMLQHI